MAAINKRSIYLGKDIVKEDIGTAWALSGAAARAIALMRQVEVAIARGEKPDVIIGNSSGALTAPIAAVAYEYPEILPEAIRFAETLDTADMFPYKGNVPFNKKGNPRPMSVLRALGHGHLGWQDIKPLYKKVFTEEYFEIFKKSNIKCIAFGVKGSDWSPVEYVLNDAETLDEMIDMIECSSRIVPFVQPMEFRGEAHVDGGFVSFNPGMWLFEKYNMERLVTMYSREVKFAMHKNPNWHKGKLPVLGIVTQAMNGTSYWLGNKDAIIEECFSALTGTEYIRLEAPDGYTDEVYETDDHQLIALGNASFEKANKEWDEFELLPTKQRFTIIN